jgi:Flp pilus assembly pilin Flp
MPIAKLRNSTRGAAIVEYGILLSLISVTALGAVVGLGRETEEVYQDVTTALLDKTGPTTGEDKGPGTPPGGPVTPEDETGTSPGVTLPPPGGPQPVIPRENECAVVPDNGFNHSGSSFMPATCFSHENTSGSTGFVFDEASTNLPIYTRGTGNGWMGLTVAGDDGDNVVAIGTTPTLAYIFGDAGEDGVYAFGHKMADATFERYDEEYYIARMDPGIQIITGLVEYYWFDDGKVYLKDLGLEVPPSDPSPPPSGGSGSGPEWTMKRFPDPNGAYSVGFTSVPSSSGCTVWGVDGKRDSLGDWNGTNCIVRSGNGDTFVDGSLARDESKRLIMFVRGAGPGTDRDLHYHESAVSMEISNVYVFEEDARNTYLNVPAMGPRSGDAKEQANWDNEIPFGGYNQVFFLGRQSWEASIEYNENSESCTVSFPDGPVLEWGGRLDEIVFADSRWNNDDIHAQMPEWSVCQYPY